MRIDKLVIKNFRNYIGEHIFPLDKTITILYGENGFGKSCFFDAVEWCLTGGISRFVGYDKKDVATRYLNEDFECSVSITFGGDIITRSFKFSDGECGNVQVKVVQKDGSIINGNDNVDAFLKKEYFEQVNFGGGFTNLIKQTYILSQDQITDFIINDDPKNRFKALANIMGFKQVLNLSNNMKRVLSALKNKSDKLQTRIDELEGLIASKQETKSKINFEEFRSKLLSIFDNAEIPTKEITQRYLNKYFAEKQKHEVLLKECKEININEYRSLSDLRRELEELHSRIKINQELQKIFEKINIKLVNKINLVSTEQVNFKRIFDLTKMIEEKRKNLKHLGDNLTISEIEKILKLKRTDSSEIQFSLSFQSEFKEYLLQRQHIPGTLKKLKIDLGGLTRKKLRIINIIDRLSSILINREDNALIKLLASIREVSIYIENNDTEGRCPVCASYKGDNLKDSLKANISLYSDRISKQADYVNKCLKLKLMLDERLEAINNQIEKINISDKSWQQMLNNANQRIDDIKFNKLYKEKIFSLSKDELNLRLVEIGTDIKNGDLAISELIAIRELESEYKTLTNLVGNIESSSRTFEEKLRRHLRRMSKAKDRLQVSQTNKEKIIRDDERRYNTIRTKYEQFLTLLDKPMIGVTFAEIINKQEKCVYILNNKIDLLNEINNILMKLELNSGIDKQIALLVSDREKANIQWCDLEQAINVIQTYVENIYKKFGSQAKDFLNKPSSAIQKYYRYLNPMPACNTIMFGGEEEELDINVLFETAPRCEEHTVMNTKKTLSSGQLNVLAISIFLAINESQRIHPLDFVAIDDPIQNMDDVNQFSVCDILSSIKRQIIFSTHDIEFLKLFIKKNEHRKQDVQVFSLKSPYLRSEKVDHILFDRN
ncbi:SMC family ATPase [Anaerospora hongkongensis]|uniref:SMC family ATPase n=1 Tax=Anaerospora hongkongensis TaxID=244830 RepID=UPI00289686B9|nr:SMC family ATPase [Anaerospora hongkongensis]